MRGGRLPRGRPAHRFVAAPFALNFAGAEGGIAAFYVVMGIAVLAVSLITNYQYSPKRQAHSGASPVTA